MKSRLALLALTTALTLPAVAMARPVTLGGVLASYGGDGAYLAVYVTDAQGALIQTLWVAGGRSKYYKHLSDWVAAGGGAIDGVTGASVGAGRSFSVTVELADALLDAGYVLHVDSAVEDMRDSPSEIALPLTTDAAGQAAKGRRYISDFRFDL
ncbi:DUF2271 domain-containing protein [Cereibacter changlensis JA139]|uniref:DUF2271 domain-containing protein n=2 Tax=Cereibacter changlensis TaxID=402884 RepID=A0A2T4JNE4_9RHOB|nr:DUF2271 domain-containing protein [Cereibacter changlensis]PTE19411.1 DUF2271 domain-containing protein [Cereibacter changlensis JA139]PZX47543.1 uncharacterized protein DUF2271 [Cereibacter changlensis]